MSKVVVQRVDFGEDDPVRAGGNREGEDWEHDESVRRVGIQFRWE